MATKMKANHNQATKYLRICRPGTECQENTMNSNTGIINLISIMLIFLALKKKRIVVCIFTVF